MKLLSAQPDTDYYLWQLEVQCHNFKKYDLEKDMLILLAFDKEKGINPKAKEFASKTKAKVFFVADTRIDKSYIPSIRPHIIKKFYQQNRINEPIFYHDSDIIFKSKPDFDLLINKANNNVLVSDTISYIGGKYITSKGKKLLDEMCSIVGIGKKIVVDREEKSGGAQYLFVKRLDFMFWEKVERDCTALYNHMLKTEKKYTPDDPIQSWCADMWAILWNLWLFGVEVLVVDELKFCFPTDQIENVKSLSILHNAGVTKDKKNLFNKCEYIEKSPYAENYSNIDTKYCSYLYVQEIIETGIYNKKQ